MPRVSAPLMLVALATVAAQSVAAPTSTLGQVGSILVEHAGPDTLVVAGGERGSVPFRITNTGRTATTVGLEVVTSRGWRVAAPTPQERLAAGETIVRIVSFYPPADEAVGFYPVALEVRTGSGAMAAASVVVRVPERYELAVEIEEGPEWAMAGEAYTIRARIRNVGNVAVPFRVGVSSPYEVPAKVGAAPPSLGPGASVGVDVRVEPPLQMARGITHALRVIAMAERDTAEAVARVEIVPRGRSPRAERPSLPGELRIRASADPRAGPPLRFAASGPLAPGSGTRVDALLQGPASTYAMFGQADIYRLRIVSPNLSLDLGDNVFGLSRLTESGQEGLGIGLRARAGPVSAGGFLQRDRRSFRPDTQYAAFAGISAGRSLELRGNWFRSDSEHGSRQVMSAEGALRAAGWLVLRGEYGTRPETGSSGRTADLFASRGPMTVNLRHVGADTAFGGVYAGLFLNAAELRIRPWSSLFLEGLVESQEIERNVGGESRGDARRSARVGLGWGSLIAIEGNQLERESTSAIGADYRARSLRLRLGIPIGGFTAYPSVERGMAVPRGFGEPKSFWRAGVRSQLTTRPISIASNLEYFTGGSLHRAVDEEGMLGSASASIRFGSTQLRLSAYATKYVAPVQRENLSLDAGLDQRLPFGHRLALRVMRSSSSGLVAHDQTIALLDYTIPLRVPTGRSGGRGSIVARVFDGGTGEPLRRVIVRVADRRLVTDASGRVIVAGLPPGVYYVDIDHSTAQRGQVPSVPLPLRAEVREGEDTRLEIGMVPAARLTIRATVLRATSASGRVEESAPNPLGLAVVELRREGERIRRETDASGTIHVQNLRPGSWTVKVLGAPLPPFHRFERDSLVVEVRAGSRSEVTFEAAPVQRPIRIVASGELVERRAEEDREPRRALQEPRTQAAEPPRLAEGQGSQRRQPAAPLGVPRPETERPTTGTPAQPEPPAVRRRPRVPSEPRRVEREQPATGQAAAGRFTTINVVEGDANLRSIAALVYGDGELWPRIWLANRDLVSHPGRLFPGQVLRIPPGGPITAEERAVARRFPDQ
jgi:hypothetical protein